MKGKQHEDKSKLNKIFKTRMLTWWSQYERDKQVIFVTDNQSISQVPSPQ